ncbi:hypothetical protein [Kalamiella sp. sgz302252]|uniref:hypothetical protein n=1 Tax=Pantoea sp. sgz302252 TaxID=3341827 RepID=UPI0036D22E9A
MAKTVKNPVERRIEILQGMWLEKSAKKSKVLLWDMEDEEINFIYAFTALQRHNTLYDVSDMFISFRAPFDTLFGYSRALRNELLESYNNSLAEQGISADWQLPPEANADSVAGTLACLQSFIHCYQTRFRYLVVALTPDSVSRQSSFLNWMQLALQHEWPHNLRIMLLQSQSDPAWRPLAQEYPDDVQILQPKLYSQTLVAEIANQSTEDNTSFLYRRFMTDSLTLLKLGTPQQVAERAQKALALAQQKDWFEQQVFMHNLTAGAWLKAQAIPEAVQAYRLACGQAALIKHAPVKYQLTVQSLMGEAGAWFSGKHYQQAADIYARSAATALQIPHPLFAIEGYRMAGYCHQCNSQNALAMGFYREAIRVAAQLPADERKLTTLGVILQSLLAMQDKKRAGALVKKAADYSQQLSALQQKAEKQALASGIYPQPGKIALLEQQMEQAMEQAFLTCCRQRETLIRQSGSAFQKIIFVGRELLNLHWSGSPDIAHPFDKNSEEWQAPLSFIRTEPDATESLLNEGQAKK